MSSNIHTLGELRNREARQQLAARNQNLESLRRTRAALETTVAALEASSTARTDLVGRVSRIHEQLVAANQEMQRQTEELNHLERAVTHLEAQVNIPSLWNIVATLFGWN